MMTSKRREEIRITFLDKSRNGPVPKQVLAEVLAALDEAALEIRALRRK
jgi:hypothetical protein